MPLLFSVILPVLHADGKLGKTLDSIASQDFDDLEVLVMDGGASPSTELLVKRSPLHREGRLHYVGKPDRGIYDAMNEALNLAAGRYIYFIGAGDALRPQALAAVRDQLPASDSSLVYGNVMRGAQVYDGPFDAWRLCHRNICHQAAFYGRDIFQLVGRFSLSYPACADWEFNMRCYGDSRIAKHYIETVVADFEQGGLSAHGDPAFNRDHGHLIRRHLGLLPFLRWAIGVTKTRALTRLRHE
ncbi:glycosyltransferase family 2 protein [Verrucomicrobium sp. BvORR034]|uniref:glycosyltransferase family 2 protein n=1 Tax=Verrucomicrobium sp. BvORR034 TaxID=1396418 RepID=UPI000678C7B5|nr:glycosyltransferase family 2 protein [Verrucomicrobium sp. BvORR034]